MEYPTSINCPHKTKEEGKKWTWNQEYEKRGGKGEERGDVMREQLELHRRCVVERWDCGGA